MRREEQLQNALGEILLVTEGDGDLLGAMGVEGHCLHAVITPYQ